MANRILVEMNYSAIKMSMRRLVRVMSTSATEHAKPNESKFTRTKNFFYVNRQHIINTIGMAYVFYYAIYNTKVRAAWDEREAEVAVIKAELDEYRSILTDENWINDLDTNVRNGGTTKKMFQKKFHKLYRNDETRFINEQESNGGSGML